MPRSPLSDLQWNLGTVAKMSLGGDDFVEDDDSAYVTIDDAEGAVCEINIEGQHAREAALVTVAAPHLLTAVESLIEQLRPLFDANLLNEATTEAYRKGRAAIAKAEGRT